MMKRFIPIVLLWVCGCGGSMRLAQESLAIGQDSNLEIRNAFLAKSWGLNRALITEPRRGYVAEAKPAILESAGGPNGTVDAGAAMSLAVVRRVSPRCREKTLCATGGAGRMVIHGSEADHRFNQFVRVARGRHRCAGAAGRGEGRRGLSMPEPCLRLPDGQNVSDSVLLLQARADPKLLEGRSDAGEACDVGRCR